MIRKVLFFLVIVFCFQFNSYSQVITNEGAHISLSEDIFLVSKDANNQVAGNITNNGNLNLSGNYTSSGSSQGSGFYRIGGNWTHTGLFTPSLGTVIFNGSVNQVVTHPGRLFHNFYIFNSGPVLPVLSNKVIIANDIEVLNVLSMKSGVIDAAGFIFFLSNFSANSLNYISADGSRVLGKFKRNVGETSNYLFPLGTDFHYNPANLKPNNIVFPGGVLSQFITDPVPGNAGLPVADPPVEIDSTFSDGFWSLRSNGFSTNDFDINLNATGFTDTVTSVTRILSRVAGGGWTVDGTHQVADTVLAVAYRSNLENDISPAETQFALGRPRPLIVEQPRDTIVCEDTDPYFAVEATGARTLRYTWYKVAAPQDIQILNSDPGYDGARTSRLTILNAQLDDAGDYYCIISDRYRRSTRTDTVTLIVNKIPVATATPDAQDHECTDLPFTEIVMGETYGVPGSRFLWTRDNPAGITSLMPMNGVVSNIGDAIQEYAFRNIADSPITVTFTIYPEGPAPTFCLGLPITATITVNPVPKAVPVNALPSICDMNSTLITLTSPTQMTSGNIRFDYTVSKTGGALLVGNDAAAADLIPGTEIIYQYGNNSDTIQSVFYYITPKVDNAVCPPGLVVESEVKVHAAPVQGITELVHLTCDGPAGFGALRVDISKGADPYQVNWAGPDDYTNNTDFSIYDLSTGAYFATVTDNLGCIANETHYLVPLYAEPYIYATPISPGGYHISCRDTADAKITIAVTDGITPPYNFWFLKDGVILDNGVFMTNYSATDPTSYRIYQGMGAGTYTLRFIDNNGCLRERTITLRVPPPIVATFNLSDYNGSNVSCKGYSDGWIKVDSILGGRGYYRYLWSTPDGNIPCPVNTDSIYNISAGTYYLDVTDTLGCPQRFVIEISEPEGMELESFSLSESPDHNFNVSCNGGNDGSIIMNITGGSGTYTYSWIGPDGYSSTADTVTGLAAGIYICTVTDPNGCILYATPGVLPVFTLSEPDPLEIDFSASVSADGDYQINCYGGTGSIDVNVTGGSVDNYTYNWSTTDGTGIVQSQEDQLSLGAGTYHLEVRDLNGCLATREIIMTQPPDLELQLIPKHVTCAAPGLNNGEVDLIVTGGAGQFTYSWSNGATSEDISGLAGGTYTVTVTYNNTCSKTASIDIHLPPQLTFNTTLSNYNSYEVSCYGMSDGEIYASPVTGQAPFTYNLAGPEGYSSVNGTGEFNSLRAGVYTLTVTDANLCTSTEVITMREPGRLEARLVLSQSLTGGFNLNCAGDSTGMITVNPQNSVNNVSYLWSDGFMGRLRTGLKAGEYRVVITDDNNCQAESIIVLTEPDSIRLTLEVDPPFCPDMPDGSVTAIVTGGIPGTQYSYLWSDNSASERLSNIPGGYYSVVVTDLNGCVVRDSVTVIPENESCLIVPNIISPNGDLINDYWNIGMRELYPEMVVTIFNRWGETVWRSERGYPSPWDGKSNGSLLPIDSYHYIIDLKNGTSPVIGNITIVK